ncbi:Mechanosensitive ion channel [uncultured archaeon]|nr:Mechanosensitive ion channel [uncultured archaeon]
MPRNWTYPAMLVSIAGLLWLANYWYQNVHLTRGIATIIVLVFIYLVFKLFFEDRYITKIADPQRRYYISKSFYFLYILLNIFVFWIIWVEDLQSLVLGFGLVAAAFTLTMQDVAKNFVGGLSIFFLKIYRVGDRIEIGSKMGDVIDIDIFYTTIMEISEWVAADQPTGRLSIIPNSYVLFNIINNFTKDFDFLWDEVSFPITYSSDWRAARTLIVEAISQETKAVEELAKKEISHMELKYFLSGGSMNAEVFVKLTDNWIELTARYITPARQRRTIRNKISQKILEGIEKSENIKIASQTVDIVGFPKAD